MSTTYECAVCGDPAKSTYVCIQCGHCFCDDCWDKQIAHKPGDRGVVVLHHEKIKPEVYERLRKALDPPPLTEEQRQAQHDEDEGSKWFGVWEPDPPDPPVFQDYGRYASIMAESYTPDRPVRYPQLVSFIGQTGAGKSTLVKMLVDLGESGPLQSGLDPESRFPSPVVGAIGDNLPTSGDVHLYSNPATYLGRSPMLYADCEGLDGGASLPRGARKEPEGLARSSHSIPSNYTSGFGKKLRQLARTSKRFLRWADNSGKRRRLYAVKNLYPRLLFTFSDVVVFVLRNERAFEATVLGDLLEWGEASIERSLNQPALPHAVIVLNAADPRTEETQWKVKTATNRLMSTLNEAITRNPQVKAFVDLWEKRKGKIETTEQLLKCYYASINVIRIPTKARYAKIDDQLCELRDTIRDCCQLAYQTKSNVHMLFNGDQLQTYLEAAFDHFAQNLEKPFDFVKWALKNNPIPQDFSDNILRLALAIRDHGRLDNSMLGAPKLFQELSYMVASCVVLDSVRQGRAGLPTDLIDHYLRHCDKALDGFRDRYERCTFQNNLGRCLNTKSGHDPKGHQDSVGKILASGEYQTDFEPNYREKWHLALRQHIGDFQQKLQERGQEKALVDKDIPKEAVASTLHRECMNTFYDKLSGAENFKSNIICFSCLQELPEHVLPCGHVLCTPCIYAYGQRKGRTLIIVESCPLHETTWPKPCRIQEKPEYAGTRILTLDGGGVRGIVELEILKGIEIDLEGMPIRAFFDLIVGTSTGGIIALGLGVEDWPVDTCTSNFTALCPQAFKTREFSKVKVLGHLFAAKHRSRYKTRPFEEALQDKFKNGLLFGGPSRGDTFPIKVAVTSVTNADQRPIIISNYNRRDRIRGISAGNLTQNRDPIYEFERSDNSESGLKTWEAARATSAAPVYFKAFVKKGTGHRYLDGGLYHNNPILIANRERKRLWPDVAQNPPDIVLSIGTGKSKGGMDGNPKKQERLFEHRRKVGVLTEAFKLAVSRLDNLLDCDKAWDDFIETCSDQERDRYIRINPDLGYDPPPLDAVNTLYDLQKDVKAKIREDPEMEKSILEIAHRLVASTFYFELVAVKPADGENVCTGSIHCRFDDDSHLMRSLGGFLSKRQSSSFQPFFVVQSDESSRIEQVIEIPEDVIAKMCSHGTFEMPNLCFPISDHRTSTISLVLGGRESPRFPISGFPRTLTTERKHN